MAAINLLDAIKEVKSQVPNFTDRLLWEMKNLVDNELRKRGRVF